MATYKVKEIYNKNSLELLLKYGDSCARDRIKSFMCYNDHCPAEKCTFPLGRAQGETCGHVINVKLLMNKLINVMDD
jgi:hypothetical protein